MAGGRYAFVLFALLAALVEQTYGSSSHELPHCQTPSPYYKRIETFTPAWFRANVLSSIQQRYVASHGLFPNALFYTRGMSELARQYACNAALITIWDAWPEELYDGSNASSNAYSCIHHDAGARNAFFGNMSEAFATLATGSVLVMHDAADYLQPPEDGIWATVERRAIFSRRTAVRRISQMSRVDESSILAIWDHATGLLADSIRRFLGEDTWVAISQRFQAQEGGRTTAKRDVEPQQVLKEDEPAPACRQLPAYTLPVDW